MPQHVWLPKIGQRIILGPLRTLLLDWRPNPSLKIGFSSWVEHFLELGPTKFGKGCHVSATSFSHTLDLGP